MKCLICEKESIGEVCNQCIRKEESIYSKEWEHKEGLFVKKIEEYKIAVSTMRIFGTGVISTTNTGLNARTDSFNHYIGNVKEISSGTYNGKTVPMLIISMASGSIRYIMLPYFEDITNLEASINKAKQ